MSSDSGNLDNNIGEEEEKGEVRSGNQEEDVGHETPLSGDKSGFHEKKELIIDTSPNLISKHPFSIEFEPEKDVSSPTTPLTIAHRLHRHQDPEQIGYPSDSEDVDKSSTLLSTESDGKCDDIPTHLLIYLSYFFGMVTDLYFLYNFWNLHLRVIRDTFFYNLVDTGFNAFSLTAIFTFLFPLLIVFCLPSSCYCCGSGLIFFDLGIHFVSWLCLSFTLIENVDSRLILQCIFFIVYFYKFAVILGSSSSKTSIQYVRFKHANILSFLYIACLRLSFIGYIPFYVSGWMAGITISIGFFCIAYLFTEEILTVFCFPKIWKVMNKEVYNETIHLPNEVFKHLFPHRKPFSERFFGLLSQYFNRPSSAIIRKEKIYEKKKKKNSGALYCCLLFFVEVILGFLQIFSLVIFSVGFGAVL